MPFREVSTARGVKTWNGEFGRTPTVELHAPGTNKGLGKGRSQNNHGFTTWLASGVQAVHVHGATDDFASKAVANRVHVHDLHATILRLMGLDHKRLSYCCSGRDYNVREVVHDIIA